MHILPDKLPHRSSTANPSLTQAALPVDRFFSLCAFVPSLQLKRPHIQDQPLAANSAATPVFLNVCCDALDVGARGALVLVDISSGHLHSVGNSSCAGMVRRAYSSAVESAVVVGLCCHACTAWSAAARTHPQHCTASIWNGLHYSKHAVPCCCFFEECCNKSELSCPCAALLCALVP